MSEKPNENEKLTPKEQAIKDDATCASCMHTEPSMLPILPPPGAVVRPNTMRALPVFICKNPHSEHFGQILSVLCSCSEHGRRAEIKLPKKIAAKINKSKGGIITTGN